MLWLGIDGGGTKTEAVLCDEKGHILKRVLTGATAPSSIPEQQLKDTFHGLLQELDISADQEVTAYAGISGCIKPWDRAMFEKPILPLLPSNLHLTVGGDGTCGLNAAFGPGADGLLLIIGTGSTALMRKNGQFSEIGGWGYLLGDEGSGYDMGRRAINAALRATDGRGEKTLLTDLLSRKCGVPIEEITDQMYVSGRRSIAACAGTLIEAAMAGDAVAFEQFRQCIQELRLHIEVAQKKSAGLHLAVSGGLPSHYPFLWDHLTEGLDEMQPMLLTKPPVYGAVLEALGCVPKCFEANFMQDYHRLTGVKKKEGNQE